MDERVEASPEEGGSSLSSLFCSNQPPEKTEEALPGNKGSSSGVSRRCDDTFRHSLAHGRVKDCSSLGSLPCPNQALASNVFLNLVCDGRIRVTNKQNGGPSIVGISILLTPTLIQGVIFDGESTG